MKRIFLSIILFCSFSAYAQTVDTGTYSGKICDVKEPAICEEMTVEIEVPEFSSSRRNFLVVKSVDDDVLAVLAYAEIHSNYYGISSYSCDDPGCTGSLQTQYIMQYSSRGKSTLKIVDQQNFYPEFEEEDDGDDEYGVRSTFTGTLKKIK